MTIASGVPFRFMAVVRPFRGLRYGQAAGDVGGLVCPPTSTLSPGERASLAETSPYQFVHVADPETSSDDRSKYIRYARAMAKTQEWRRMGVVELSDAATLYATRIEGVVVYFGKVALKELRSSTPVDARKRDHVLRLLEATRTQYEPVVVSYPGSVEVRDDIPDFPEIATVDLSALDGISTDSFEVVAGSEVFDAASAFRTALGERGEAVPEDDVLVALVPQSAKIQISSGLVFRALGEDR